MSLFKRKPKEALDLHAPQREGEVAFDNLQLTRLGNAIEGRLKSFLRGFAITLGLFILGFVIFVARTGQQDSEIKDQVERILAVRVEARRATCIKDKKFAEAHNRFVNDDAEGDKAFIVTLITAGGQREPSPETQRIADLEFQKIEKQRQINLVEVPTCTPPAIEEFYAGERSTTTKVADP